MLRSISVVSILAAFVVLIGFAAKAEAKGPFHVEISGGGLSTPVVLNGEIDERVIFGGDSPSNLSTIPNPASAHSSPYKLTLFGLDARSGKRHDFMSLSYYPAQNAQAATLRGQGGTFFAIQPEFQRLLANALQAADTALPQSGGPPTTGESPDGVLSPLLYLALGLSLILGGGVVAARLLRSGHVAH